MTDPGMRDLNTAVDLLKQANRVANGKTMTDLGFD
jgi:hypothetical protein